MFRINGFPSCFCKKLLLSMNWFNWLIFRKIPNKPLCNLCMSYDIGTIEPAEAALGRALGGSKLNRHGKLPISWVDYHMLNIKICWSFHPAMLIYRSVYLIQFQMYHHFISKKNTTKPHRPVFEVVTPLAGWRIGRGTMGDMHSSIIPQWTNLTRRVLGNRMIAYEYVNLY